jgi:hypothetical protein
MQKRLTPLTWFGILSLLTVGLALGLPPDPSAVHQLHTSAVAYRVAIAVLLIPYVFIWYLGFYTFAKLQAYTKPIKNTKDGKAFHTITLGMGVLAFSLVIPTTIALVLNYLAVRHPSFKTASIVIDNYLGLYPGLIAFLLLFNGSRLLLRTVKGSAEQIDLRWHAPWFLLLGVTFSHLVTQNRYLYHPYHLSTELLIITIIVPYLYGWLVGLLCAYQLRLYAKTVEGLLYRQAVQQFANGIAVAIAGSIAIQFVNTTLAKRLNTSLGAILLVDYLLLILVAIGLILMALGTKKLRKIEEL